MDTNRNWGVRCQVPSCRIAKKNFPNCKFFRFPLKDTERFNLWIGELVIEVPKIKAPYICANHFQKQDIGTKYLKKTAKPFLLTEHNDPNPTFLFSGKTYSSSFNQQTTDDLTLEEFERCTPCSSQFVNSGIEFRCNSCRKLERSVMFYRNRYVKINRKYENLKKKVKSNKTKIANNKMLIKLAKIKYSNVNVNNKNSISNVIDNLAHVSVNGKILAKTILRNPSDHQQWDEEIRVLAQNIHYVSPACYKFIRNRLNVNLPTLSS